MQQLKKSKMLILENLQKDLSQRIPQEIWHIDYNSNQVFLCSMLEQNDVFIEVVDPCRLYWCVTGHIDILFDTIDQIVEFAAEWFQV